MHKHLNINTKFMPLELWRRMIEEKKWGNTLCKWTHRVSKHTNTHLFQKMNLYEHKSTNRRHLRLCLVTSGYISVQFFTITIWTWPNCVKIACGSSHSSTVSLVRRRQDTFKHLHWPHSPQLKGCSQSLPYRQSTLTDIHSILQSAWITWVKLWVQESLHLP